MNTSADRHTDQPVLLREDREGIVRLTLNRPARYNALCAEMLTSLPDQLDGIGRDLKEMRSSEEPEFHRDLFDQREPARKGR